VSRKIWGIVFSKTCAQPETGKRPRRRQPSPSSSSLFSRRGWRVVPFFIAAQAGACLDGQLLVDRPIAPMFGAREQAAPVVRGEIRNLPESAMDLAIVLSGVAGGRSFRTGVAGDGTFELINVPPGGYLLRLVDAHTPEQSLLEQMVRIESADQPIVLEFPRASTQSPASTVPADQLRHPLSRKGAGMIRKAQDYAKAGEHARAIQELSRALKDPSAAPYAHSLLGVEYLKTHQPGAALNELEQAAQSLPHDTGVHSNLGYALLLSGDLDRAEEEIRRALDLDGGNSSARFLRDYIAKARASVMLR
jgi:tetratricopeptide (TPR) repeat protein